MKAWTAALVVAAGLRAATPGIDVTTIVRRSVEANRHDWQAAPNYNYLEQDRGHGGFKTYQVSMLLGSPYRKLVAMNSEPLSLAQQVEEQRKLDRVTAQRRRESPAQRAARVAAYREGRRRDRQLIDQLAQAFRFRLLGQQRLDQHTVYVLEATPRPGYVPPTRDTKVLTGMEGKLWIDTKTFQWVKVEAKVVRPVWIEGFLARVDPGTQFELEYAPVTNEVWLPTRFAMQSHAKVMFLFPRRGRANEVYFAYQQAGGSSL